MLPFKRHVHTSVAPEGRKHLGTTSMGGSQSSTFVLQGTACCFWVLRSLVPTTGLSTSPHHSGQGEEWVVFMRGEERRVQLPFLYPWPPSVPAHSSPPNLMAVVNPSTAFCPHSGPSLLSLLCLRQSRVPEYVGSGLPHESVIGIFFVILLIFRGEPVDRLN